jgi:hypothetical protein
VVGNLLMLIDGRCGINESAKRAQCLGPST